MRAETSIKTPVIVNILRFSLLIGLFFLPGFYGFGQAKFTTVVSSQDIGKSDYLQIQFTVENAKQIDEMTPPTFAGFQVVQGPIQSSGMSIVNGNVSQYKAVSYVLQPTRTGKFTISGASATVDDKPMRSNPVTVTVHAGGSGSANSNPNSQQGGPANPFANPFGNSFFPPNMPDPFAPESGEIDRDYVLKPGENVKEKINKNLFVKVQVDKKSCYVGEPIVATYKLYSRLSSESRVTKRPSLNGFSVYDMVDPSTDQVSVEKINGKAFTVHTIRKTQLIPLQSGTIDLDPVEVENTVHFVKGRTRQAVHSGGNSIRDLIDQMNDENDMGPEVDENVTINTKPLAITVKPLPDENKPAAFNGAVGNFSIEASLNNKSVAAEDEATLHVVVRGKGNLPVITAPVVNWPSDLEAFDPQAKEDVNKTVAPMSGSKSFDYIFTPRTAGHYTIPAISFPYFDPASQSYKTAGTQPLELQVTPAVKSHKRPAGTVAATAAPVSTDYVAFAKEHIEWIAAFLLLSAVAIYLWRQNRKLRLEGREMATAANKKSEPVKTLPTLEVAAAGERSNSPEKWMNPTPPPSETPAAEERAALGATSASYVPATPVIDPLHEAKQLFENNNSSGFYREVNRAIWKAINKKLELPTSELNKQNVLWHLKRRGWDETTLFSLENTLNECEMNLYTPAYDRYNMQQLLKQAERVLGRLG